MAKVIKNLLTGIIGKDGLFSYNEKLVMSYSLFSGICSGVGILTNFFLGFSSINIWLVSISFIIYSFNYIIARLFNNTIISKWIFSTYTLFFCNFYWLYNFGSRGSAMYIFLAYYSVMIFIWDNKQIFFITILVLLDLIVLFCLEYLIPDLIPIYPTEHARIIDSYAFLFMFIGIYSILIVSAKNNYIRQYKRAQQSDKLKSAFLANMSHEIRTPLNAIVGFTTLMAKKELPKEKKLNYSHLITENSNYLMQIVSDILDISQIESGQLKVNSSIMNVNVLFERIYQNFKNLLNQLGKNEIQLLTDMQLNSLFLETDPIRLEQIVSNLLNNAIKFTKEGYIKFGFYIEGNEVIFFVEDTGRGIKEEFQPQIFNRFVKDEDDTEIKFARGSGIGLSLSKHLVELLNGKIWFTSHYQEGSIFYFSLPIQVSQ
jgi:signal transduction histidine kinase